ALRVFCFGERAPSLANVTRAGKRSETHIVSGRPSVATSSRRSSIRTDRLRGMGEQPTLYEWAGGREAFDRMINAFYDRVENDELLSPLFPGGVHDDHRRNVAAWWSEVFGGPSVYTDELGGYERMINKHLRLGMTAEQRFRFVALMSHAADDADMPDDPEF